MVLILQLFAKFVSVLISAVSYAMMARAILSFFLAEEDSRIMTFLAFVTEPFIAPVRYLLAKFNILQDTPIDWSFTVTYMIIILVQMILPAV